MDLSDLMIFKTVAEEGGIVRAAQKLHRVPSNITTRIKQLEALIGVELFLRERRRLKISPRGESLLVYANRLLHLADEARHSVAGTLPSGTLRLGALESSCASRLPAVLSRFHKSYPDVRVILQTGTNDTLTEWVKERRLDAAFVAEKPDDATLSSRPAFQERLILISPSGHPPIYRARDARNDSVIAFPSGCAYRRILEQWMGRQLGSARVLELGSYHAIVACVAAGTGIALIPESVLDGVHSQGVARHHIPKVLEIVRTPLIWRTSEPSPSVLALHELLGSQTRDRAVTHYSRPGKTAR